MNIFDKFPDNNDGKERKARLSEGLIPWLIDKVECYIRPISSTDYKDWVKVDASREQDMKRNSVRYDLILSYKDRSNTVRYYPRENTAWKFQSVFEAAGVTSGDPTDLVGVTVDFLTYKAPSKNYNYYWAVYDVVREDPQEAFKSIAQAVERGFLKVADKSMFSQNSDRAKINKIKETFDGEDAKDDLPF